MTPTYLYSPPQYKFDDDKPYRAVGVLAPGEVKELGDLEIQWR